jgi:hypothetical protein
MRSYAPGRGLAIVVADTDGGKLPGTLKDAAAMSKTLKACGFDVKELMDPGNLLKEVKAFLAAVKPGRYARFWFNYSGHGFTADTKDVYHAFMYTTGGEVALADVMHHVATSAAFEGEEAPCMYLLDCCRKLDASGGKPSRVAAKYAFNHAGVLLATGINLGVDDDGATLSRVTAEKLQKYKGTKSLQDIVVGHVMPPITERQGVPPTFINLGLRIVTF